MKRKLFLSSALLMVLVLLGVVAGSGLAQESGSQDACLPEQAGHCELVDYSFLDEAVSFDHFVVHYTLSTRADRLAIPKIDELSSDDVAYSIGTMLEALWDKYATDSNYRFSPPAGTGRVGSPEQIDVYILDFEWNGCGCWDSTAVPPQPFPCMQLNNHTIDQGANTFYSDDVWQLLAHELFHRVQYSYGKLGEEEWSVEGTAITMQDKVRDSLDRRPSGSYIERVTNLITNPNKELLDQKRDAALWWTYYMQTCGTVDEEPERGMDALRLYWQQTRGAFPAHNVVAMTRAIQDAHGCPDLNSMEDLYHEFMVTNYVKLMDNVSERYQYYDEQSGGGGTPYPDVGVWFSQTVNVANPLNRTSQTVRPFGSRYYVGFPAASCAWVQVNVDGTSGQRLLHAIVGIDGSRAYYHDDPRFRHRGEDFTRTLYNDGLDEVVAIVGAPEGEGCQPTSSGCFDLEMSCVVPTLTILRPWAHPGSVAVGAPDRPRRFLLRLSVTSGGEPVDGLTSDMFSVEVGGMDAPYVSGHYVEDEYWLLVHPPNQDVSGLPEPWLFDLDVTLNGTVSDHVDDAVYHSERIYLDEAVVIDTSSSMNNPPSSPKLEVAKTAAKLFVSEAASRDRLGVVRYGDNAIPLFDTLLPMSSGKGDAMAAIDDLTAWGCTAVGDGLRAARNVIREPEPAGEPDHSDVIVLISGSTEDQQPCWEYGTLSCGGEDCRSGPYLESEFPEYGIPVHTVALGEGAHERRLQRISRATGGRYVSASGSPLNYATAVADRTDFLVTTVNNQVRAYRGTLVHPEPDPWSLGIPLDPSIGPATFTVFHTTPGQDLGRKVWLVTPGGETIDAGTLPAGGEYQPDAYHDVYHIPEPEPGEWQVHVSYDPVAVAPPPGESLVTLSGESPAGLELMIGAPLEELVTGNAIPVVVAFFGTEKLLPGATLTARVIGVETDVPLTLRDDGLHGDGEAGDGVYGASFTQATQEGSYTLLVEGQHGEIVRHALASFFVEAGDDGDGDGLPDGWEKRYGLNSDANDALEDPDWDELDNLTEFQQGTNPVDDDTDDDGESDASEILAGSDPVNNPDDAALETPTTFRAEAGIEEVVIRYDVWPEYEQLLLYWSTDPTMPDWQAHEIEIENKGAYTHSDLTNDTTYYYRLAALTEEGNRSGYTAIRSATPKEDPYPPRGMMNVDYGHHTTRSPYSELVITAADDGPYHDAGGGPNRNPPAEMRVSSDPEDLSAEPPGRAPAGAEWEPFERTKHWEFDPALGRKTVYIQFRDAAGNVSPVEQDSIVLVQRMAYLPLILRDYD